MVGIFEDHHWEYGFIGRADKLREAQVAWNEGKQIIGIYGFKKVGKTRFAKELILRQGVVEGNVYALDFGGITSLTDLVIHVSTALAVEEPLNDRNWVRGICRCVSKRIADKEVVLCIDNAEDVDEVEELKTAFMQLCEAMIKVSRLVKVVFTSSLKFRFAGVRKVYKSIELLQLTPEESRKLLMEIVNGLDLDGQENKLIELCSGLPLALMIAGSELIEDERQLSPRELVTLLERSRLEPMSREHYGEDEQMGNVVGGAISRLCDLLQQNYASVTYIPGTFNKEAAAAVLDLDNNAQAMDKALIPLARRCLVYYDGQTERFDINDMQREFVMNNIHIRDILGVRTRFCQFFSQCLIQLQKTVDSKDSGQALVPINMELKNFKKLLETAAHSSGDGTFDVFMEAAMEANYLIQFYMPEQVVQFYEVMLETCVEHGTDFETGVLMSILGEMVSENKGDYKGGLEWYWKAEQKLLPHGNSRRLAEVYQHIGWHHYTNGNGDEAVKYHKKSYRMLKALNVEEDLQFARVMNCLGVAYVYIGKAKEAEKYHLRSLAMRLRLVGEKHLNIAMHYNNVGLMYELKEDYEKAIEYFAKSYKLKLEILGPSKTVIISMRNLGLQWVREGEYQKALDLVQENLETFDQVPDDDQTSRANILKVQGAAYLGMGEYAKAEGFLKQLLAVQKETIPGHRTLVKTFTQLGQAARKQSHLDEAKDYLQEAYNMKSSAITCRGKFLFENLQEFAKVYLDSGDLQRAADYYKEALCELHRVGDQLIRESEDDKSRSIAEDIRSLLQEIDNANCGARVAVPQPCDEAHQSCCLRTFAEIVYGTEYVGILNSFQELPSHSHQASDSPQIRHDKIATNGRPTPDASHPGMSSVNGRPIADDRQPGTASVNQAPPDRPPYWTTGHVYPTYVPQTYDLDHMRSTADNRTQSGGRKLESHLSEEADPLNDSLNSSKYFADASSNGDQCLPTQLDSWIVQQQAVLNAGQVGYTEAKEESIGGPPRPHEECLPSNISTWIHQHQTTSGSDDPLWQCGAGVNAETRQGVGQQTHPSILPSHLTPTNVPTPQERQIFLHPPRTRSSSETTTIVSEDLYLGFSDTEESFMKSLENRGARSNALPPRTQVPEAGHPHLTTTGTPNLVPSPTPSPRNPYRRQQAQAPTDHNQMQRLYYPPNMPWQPPHSSVQPPQWDHPREPPQWDHSRMQPPQTDRSREPPQQGNFGMQQGMQPPQTDHSMQPGAKATLYGYGFDQQTVRTGVSQPPPHTEQKGQLPSPVNSASQGRVQLDRVGLPESSSYNLDSPSHPSQTAVKSVNSTGPVPPPNETSESQGSSSLFSLDSLGGWFSGGKHRPSKIHHL